MEEMIALFRMNEIDGKIRARIIIKLGNALNYQMGMNWTEAIVFELVSILDPTNEIIELDRFKNAK
ncbi:MAG: hypothetical protein RLZZ196_976 [Bacteroidota bacterium]|jgi:hypothetical protein